MGRPRNGRNRSRHRRPAPDDPARQRRAAEPTPCLYTPIRCAWVPQPACPSRRRRGFRPARLP
jgi:hypothetical protein